MCPSTEANRLLSNPLSSRTASWLACVPGRDGETTTDLTRIGAVMTIEERYRDTDDGEVEVRHSVIVVHNPFAEKRISPSLFGGVPQLVPEGTQMRWTDAYTGV
jgi:hypothetical protein